MKAKINGENEIYSYREIKMADCEALANMYMETFNAAPWFDTWTMETAQKRLSYMIEAKGFSGLMVYYKGVLAGMILGEKEQYFNGVIFTIKEFCVSNELRNLGIGSKLLEEFEGRLQEQGVNEVILLTSRSNGTEEFYKKRGLSTYLGMVVMGKVI